MRNDRKYAQQIVVRLSRDQALVLFDWLSRFTDDGAVVFEDQAEQRVLWDLQAILEKNLVEPLNVEYRSLLERARAALRDSEE